MLYKTSNHLQLELPLFPDSVSPAESRTESEIKLPLWNELPKTWNYGWNHLVISDKQNFIRVVDKCLREYWKRAEGVDKTPCCAFLAVFKDIPKQSLDEAASILKLGLHPDAASDFEKALKISKI